MVPNGGNGLLRPAPGQPGGMDPARQSQVLTIEFVRAAGDSINGTLAPYLDPDCSCSTSATFRGRVDGDRISGVFTATQSTTGRSGTGTWEVQRRR